VRTGMVTYAVRDTELEDMHIKAGDIIGLNNGRITVSGGTAEDAAFALVKEIVTDDDGLITVYYGEETKKEDAGILGKRIAAEFPFCDVELHRGGQQLYFYLLSVE